MSSEEENKVKATYQKHKLYNQLSDVNKKIRLQVMKVVQVVIAEEQLARILKYNNLLPSRNEQNLYLSGLISVLEIQRRRPRKEESEAKLHTENYAYRVKVVEETQQLDVPVCVSAFIAIHGITRKQDN